MTSLAIPGELDFHPPPLVAMDLFPCRADYRRDLRTIDTRPRQRCGTPFDVLGHQFGAQVVAHPQRGVGGLFLLAGILGAAMDHPGTKREDVERGQVLAKPGTIKPHTKFECEVYVLSKEEGGRHTPFFKGYRPQFYFRTTDVTGNCELPEGVEMVMPGDNIKMVVTLIAPIAMEDGLRFAIREGGRTVGPKDTQRKL